MAIKGIRKGAKRTQRGRSVDSATTRVNDDRLSRLGISVPDSLLNQFDRLMAEKKWGNRSDAVRHLMREALIGEAVADPNAEAVGTLTLIYDHHVRQLNDRLTDIQHDHHDQIVSTLHVHLDHHNCLEVVVLRGPAGEIRRLADSLSGTRGVRHGKLTLTSAVAR